jgi:hypothetical protein
MKQVTTEINTGSAVVRSDLAYMFTSPVIHIAHSVYSMHGGLHPIAEHEATGVL